MMLVDQGPRRLLRLSRLGQDAALPGTGAKGRIVRPRRELDYYDGEIP